MKIEEIARIADGVLPKMKVIVSNHQSNNSYKYISGHIYVNSVVRFMLQKKIFTPICEEIKGIDIIYNSGIETMLVESHVAYGYQEKVERLMAAMACFSSNISQHMKRTEEGILSFKLPAIDGLDEFTEVIRDLNRSLGVVLADSSINEKCRIHKFDNGTLWIEIAIGIGLGAKVVAGIIWASCVIRKKMKEIEIMDKNLRSLDLKNEMLEHLVHAQRKQLDNIIQAESQMLVDAILKDADPEMFAKLKTAIETVAGLVNRGAEFRISPESPEELQKSFPDFDKIESVESRVKNINHKP